MPQHDLLGSGSRSVTYLAVFDGGRNRVHGMLRAWRACGELSGTLASLARASAAAARSSASAALLTAAASSSSCRFWYSGARLRLSRSATCASSRAIAAPASRAAASAAAVRSAASCANPSCYQTRSMMLSGSLGNACACLSITPHAPPAKRSLNLHHTRLPQARPFALPLLCQVALECNMIWWECCASCSACSWLSVSATCISRCKADAPAVRVAASLCAARPAAPTDMDTHVALTSPLRRAASSSASLDIARASAAAAAASAAAKRCCCRAAAAAASPAAASAASAAALSSR